MVGIGGWFQNLELRNGYTSINFEAWTTSQEHLLEKQKKTLLLNEMWQPGRQPEDCNLKEYYGDLEVLDLLNDLSNDAAHTNYYMLNDPKEVTVKNGEGYVSDR